MIWNLSIGDAMDAVDIYGPDPDFWPRNRRDAMQDLLERDEDFADYVEQARMLDEMLNNWDETEDGAEINWDDLEDPDDEDDDDAEYERGEGGEGIAGGGAARGAGATESDDPLTVHEEHVNQHIRDMDDMLSNIIMEYASQGDPDEFRVFTRDYDEMVDLKGYENFPTDDIVQAVAKSTGPLQKELRRLMAARTNSFRRPGMRSGRLHAPNLHRIMAQDDRVFTRKVEQPALNTAVSLLIDCSGSMTGERINLAVQSAFALGSVLERINVPFECLGFTCNSTHPILRDKQYQRELREAHEVLPIIRHAPIIIPKFKTFDERFTLPTQRRFAAVNARGNMHHLGVNMNSTPEGCGIEFAARRLLKRPEKRKIMMVMTDGEPGGPSYQYGSIMPYRRQSEKVVAAVAASGVDIIGIGIKHSGPSQYYPNHIQVNNIEELPQRILKMLKDLLV